MVQMHPLTSSATGVSYEAEGGIRNPACQDEDSPDCKPVAAALQQRRHDDGCGRLAATAAARGNKHEPSKILHEKGRELHDIMTVCHIPVPWRFSANFVIAVIVTFVMIFGELGYIPNHQVGFYCNDPKLSLKYTGDTITVALLLVATATVPALVIWATEWTCYSSDSYKGLECGSSSRSRQFWKWFGYYTLGWWYMLFVVEFTKVVVAEPRPHFIDSCRPKEIVNCTNNQYLKSYTCTNKDLPWFNVNDSDKSFPSGHSALSVFTATFLVWYLQARMPDRLALMLVKPWLQCCAILWGMGVSMSRITDNRHHWWDVLVGMLLGVSFALFVARVLCRGFKSGSSLSLQTQSGPPSFPVDKRHQSIKKLLSNGSSVDIPENRELGDLPPSWTA